MEFILFTAISTICFSLIWSYLENALLIAQITSRTIDVSISIDGLIACTPSQQSYLFTNDPLLYNDLFNCAGSFTFCKSMGILLKYVLNWSSFFLRKILAFSLNVFSSSLSSSRGYTSKNVSFHNSSINSYISFLALLLTIASLIKALARLLRRSVFSEGNFNVSTFGCIDAVFLFMSKPPIIASANTCKEFSWYIISSY